MRLMPLLLGLVGASWLLVCSTLLAEVPLPDAGTASSLESLSKTTFISPVREVTLDIPAGSYFEPEGRGLLKYLVSCALRANTHAQLKLPDETLTLAGSVGLAADWAERGMTSAEQRWVSACMFALTNGLGINVRVVLEATTRISLKAPSLTTSGALTGYMKAASLGICSFPIPSGTFVRV